MSSNLDPVIQEKLRAFANRRRRLIVVRGIFAALAMLLATMLVIAAVDLQVRMPDWLRWTLSGTAYFAVLVIAWRQCLSWLLHAPDSRQLARLVEHAEPRLREDLLSAVELGQSKGEVFDSEQFRMLVQDDVAGRMERMEMSRLLPVALVRKYIGYTVVVCCIVAAMIAATGWQFPTLLLRALWPSVNLDRISRTKVQIVEPEGGNRMVPQGDTVRIVVELGGERVNKASLITETGKDGWQAADMQPLGGDRFAATVNVGRENVRFRIEAGDAVTRFFLLDARERPYITEYEKTFRYPQYSKLPPKTVTEQDGAVIALDGTDVELRLKANQAIKTGELRLEQGKRSSTIPLVKGEDGRLSAHIPLNASGTYRVFLVGAETAFENKFSPENELRAEPDLVPTMELESPKTDLILPNNEMLDLIGTASDDLALAKIAQVVKVNDGPWRETVIQKEGLGQKQHVEHRWDLYEQKVKPGDFVVTKLVATDLKGNRGESRPLQITIAAAGFELRKMQALERMRSLNQTVGVLADKADLMTKAGGNVRDVFNASEDLAARKQTLLAFSSLLADYENKFNECWSTLGAALREAGQGHASAELVTVGRELSRLSQSTLAELRVQFDALNANPGSANAKNLANAVTEAGWNIQKRARLSAMAMESFLTAEEMATLSENGQVVAREQQRLLELASASGDDARKWASLSNRLRVAMTQARSLEELMEPIAKRPLSPAKDRAKQTVSELSKRRVKLETAMLTPDAGGKVLLNPTTDLARVLQNQSREFASWHRELGYKPIEMIEQIFQDVGATYGNIAKVQEDIQQVKSRTNFDESTRTALLEQRWKTRGDLIKAHGDLEELRTNADNQFVADLRMATIALDAAKQMYAGAEPAKMQERFAELDRSMRILESGHNLAEVFDGLNFVATNERWDIQNLSARTQSPRDWRWLEKRLRGIPDELGKAKQFFDQRGEAEQPVRVAFEGAQKILWNAGGMAEWRNLSQEMEQRANLDRVPVTSKADAEMLAGQVKKALDLLRASMADARLRMEKLSPKISELAAAIAKEQEKLKQETEAQAKAPEVKPEEIAQKLAEQQKLDAKVETLKDLIRAEANKQDILKPEEREKMRDADDALAMLKDPPPKAEQALQDATKDTDAQQLADLQRATEQQKKIEEALEQIAKHYDAAEKNKDLAESRAALREAEKELGIKQELDDQLAHAQMLAEMAQKNPEQLLKELEAKLPDNPEMQKELSDITKDALAAAEQKLDQAAKKENAIAAQVAEQAKSPDASTKSPSEAAAEAAKQAQQAAEAAHVAAKNAEQQADAAKNDGAKAAADRAAEAAKDSAKEASKAAEAAEKIAQAPNAQEAAKSAQRAAEKATKAAEKAAEAAAQADQAQAAAKQSAQQGGEKQAANQQSEQQAGEASAQAKKAVESAQKAAALAQQAAQAQEALAQAAQNPQKSAVQQAANEAANAAEKAAQAAQSAQKAAESAEAQANNAANPEAAKQADTAGNEAAKAAQAAQEAARNAKNAAQTGDNQQAANAAEKAAQKAGEAAQAAEKAANSAQGAQNAAQQAAQAGGEKQGENQQSAQQSGEANQQAQAAAQAAKQAQAKAQQAANIAKAAAAQQNQQLANAAQQQQPIAQNAQDAGANIERAGRHEMRLGNQAGEVLADLGEQVQKTAQADVPAAQQALAQAAKAADAVPAVQKAASDLNAQLAQLKNAQQGGQQPQATQPQGEQRAGEPQAGEPQAGQAQAGQPQSGQPQAGQPASPAEQQAMARALDALDQQLNAASPANQQQGQQGSQQAQQGQPAEAQQSQQAEASQAQSAASSAMAQAAQAAQASMRQNRAQQGMSQQPGSLVSQSQSEKSEGGALANAPGMDYKLATSAAGLKKGDWGKLPKKLAEQLTKGQQEAIAGDYRQAVETYYKVIADKAKEQKK